MAADVFAGSEPATLVADVGSPSSRKAWLEGAAWLQMWGSVAVLVIIAGACFLGPVIGNLPGPGTIVANGAMGVFSSGHVLGTDDLGRDMLSRVLLGGRVSIEVGIGSIAIGVLIGGALGTVAGYEGGVVDSVISRVLDTLLAFPALVLALAIAAALGPSVRNEIFAISFFSIPSMGRYVRGAVLQVKEEEFLASAELIGGGRFYVMLRHVVPSVAGSVTTFALLGISVAMLAEAGLSFLGAGIRPPKPSWGNMISEGQPFLSQAPHITFVPATFLCVTILALNLLGDAMRRRANV